MTLKYIHLQLPTCSCVHPWQIKQSSTCSGAQIPNTFLIVKKRLKTGTFCCTFLTSFGTGSSLYILPTFPMLCSSFFRRFYYLPLYIYIYIGLFFLHLLLIISAFLILYSLFYFFPLFYFLIQGKKQIIQLLQWLSQIKLFLRPDKIYK